MKKPLLSFRIMTQTLAAFYQDLVYLLGVPKMKDSSRTPVL
jgi:hypothetical protein